MAATRLGLGGTPAAAYAGFVAKTPAVANRADLTRLLVYGVMGARGPGFSPKAPAGGGDGSGGEWLILHRRRR